MSAPKVEENLLLKILPSADRRMVEQAAERVTLTIRQSLTKAGEPVRDVYLPISGVSSLVAKMDEGDTVEVATVGNEGIVGLPVYLGTYSMPLETFQQVPGQALRLSAADFMKITSRSKPLRQAIDRYTQAFFTQLAYAAICNRLHTVDSRCARWLLTTHDRVHVDEFVLTQEFLAQMLGVRRASVNTSLATLHRAGYLDYQRGRITIRDRKGLESAACECYGHVRAEFDRLVTHPAKNGGRVRRAGVQRRKR